MDIRYLLRHKELTANTLFPRKNEKNEMLDMAVEAEGREVRMIQNDHFLAELEEIEDALEFAEFP